MQGRQLIDGRYGIFRRFGKGLQEELYPLLIVSLAPYLGHAIIVLHTVLF